MSMKTRLHILPADQEGFTLIELLVVIAIIGILSSIVLSSITAARTQAFDAKVKGQLSNIRAAAETYYGKSLNYGIDTRGSGSTNGCATGALAGMFSDAPTNLNQLSQSANYPTGENNIVCNSNGTSYAVGDNMAATGTYWCVDSSGNSTATTGPVVAGITLVCK